MPRASSARTSQTLICGLVASLTLSATGCVSLIAHLLNASMGNRVPAAFEGLAERRVAVVCISQSSLFGPTQAAQDIGTTIESYLQRRVPEIQLVDQQEIADWMDQHDWNKIDYRELGTGVGAQLLVAAEIKSFSLYEGRTLFKGTAEVGLTVYDLTQKGRIVYQSSLPAIHYPVTGGRYTADTSEEEFRREFIDVVGYRIARHFFDYDSIEDYGRDPSFVGF
jgi:hypothetical protein